MSDLKRLFEPITVGELRSAEPDRDGAADPQPLRRRGARAGLCRRLLLAARRRGAGHLRGDERLAGSGRIESGDAELASFGRAYIANPDLVTRIATGVPPAEAPQEYWYGGDATGYSDWPRAAESAATP